MYLKCNIIGAALGPWSSEKTLLNNQIQISKESGPKGPGFALAL
jgi:hypothetical protein